MVEMLLDGLKNDEHDASLLRSVTPRRDQYYRARCPDLMVDASSPARPSLTPTPSYATFQTPARNGNNLHRDHHASDPAMLGVVGNASRSGNRGSRSTGNTRRTRPLSRAVSEGGAVLGRRFSRTSESGRSFSKRRVHRPSGTFILAHPSTAFEAISAYSPRVSAIIVDNADEEDGEDDDDDTFGPDREAGAYGVRKMELLQLKPFTVWLGVLLISTFTALSSTTTPAVEPFFVSLFGGHSFLSSIAVMTSIAYAVFKPPMAKILDVFGRAEGLALSAALYALGYFLTSTSGDLVTFCISRLIGSAGAQGINLAQQIILADITSLASRGFYVSTMFLPWLVTPWIGPPIGQLFKDMGEPGWRLVYLLSGIVVPISCFGLILILWTAYRRMLRISKLSASAVSALKDHNPNVMISESLIWQPRHALDLAQEVRNELDLRGNFYLMTGCTLLLLPLSLAASRPKAWHDRGYPFLTMLVNI
jgi:MFS family permease